jgi:hypothetical protein
MEKAAKEEAAPPVAGNTSVTKKPTEEVTSVKRASEDDVAKDQSPSIERGPGKARAAIGEQKSRRAFIAKNLEPPVKEAPGPNQADMAVEKKRIIRTTFSVDSAQPEASQGVSIHEATSKNQRNQSKDKSIVAINVASIVARRLKAAAHLRNGKESTPKQNFIRKIISDDLLTERDSRD